MNWQHALINAVALWVVARLFTPDLTPARQLSALLAAALAISACLALIYPTIVWYRGLSGALHGLFFAGSMLWLIKARPRRFQQLWLPSALFFGGWIKVALEQPGGATTPYAEWLGAGVVPQAHLVGAACGTLLGLLFAISDAHAGRQQTATTAIATAIAVARRRRRASWRRHPSLSARPLDWSYHRTS